MVTTPQPAAQRVAQRAAYMARKVNLTVAGVIENMSWFTGRDGFRYDIFGLPVVNIAKPDRKSVV